MNAQKPLVIQFPPPAKLLNMNDRLHWAQRSKLNAAWRQAAGAAAAVERRRRAWVPVPITVTIALPVRGKLRRDPHNFFATIKPCIDGLVTPGGVVPDDTPEWVTTFEPTLVVGGLDVVITCTPRTAQ